MSSKKGKKQQSDIKKEAANEPIQEIIAPSPEPVPCVSGSTICDNNVSAETLSRVSDRPPSPPPRDEMRESPVLFDLVITSYDGGRDALGFYDGQGEAHFADGHIYKGSFEGGKMTGEGVYTWSNGVVFAGSFIRNAATGRGVYSWPDGTIYDGEVVNGIRHGNGSLHSPARGAVYSGGWVHGKRQGLGLLQYDATGRSYYDGQWANDRRSGFGRRQYANGDHYEGEWGDDKNQGQGSMRWLSKGEEYDGSWRDGRQHGQGTHTWYVQRTTNSQYPLRNQYRGHFVAGQRHGLGRFDYASGASYDGEWLRNSKHGVGTFTFKNGMVYKGYFQNDCIKDHPSVIASGMTTPDIAALSSSLVAKVLPRQISPAQGVRSNEACLDFDLTPLFMQLGIDLQHHDCETVEVKRVILRYISELKATYKFYSGLGVPTSYDNALVMTVMQFTRFLKDTGAHIRGTSLIECLRFVSACGEITLDPDCPILLRDFLRGIVDVAFLLYKEEVTECHGRLIGTCLERFIVVSLLPQACRVKGTVYNNERRTKEVAKHRHTCQQIYEHIPQQRLRMDNRLPSRREVLLFVGQLRLLGDRLSATRLVHHLTTDADFPLDGAQNPCHNLEIEVTFLEFCEFIAACAIDYMAADTLHKASSNGDDQASANSTSKSQQATNEPDIPSQPSFPGQSTDVSDVLCSDCSQETRQLPPSPKGKEAPSHQKAVRTSSKSDQKTTTMAQGKESLSQHSSSRSREKRTEKGAADRRQEKLTDGKEAQPLSRKQRKSVSGVPGVANAGMSQAKRSSDSMRQASAVSMLTEEQSTADLSLAEDTGSNSSPLQQMTDDDTKNITDEEWTTRCHQFFINHLLPAFELQLSISSRIQLMQ